MKNSVRGWHGVPAEYVKQWRNLFNYNHEGLNLSVSCPVCGNVALHRYYQKLKPIERNISGIRFVADGAAWEWCSSCRSFEHLSALVPEWWSDELDFDSSKLTAEPEALEQALPGQR